jgi:hypothetical protein
VASAAAGVGIPSAWDITTDMPIKLMPGAHPFHAIAEAALEAASAGDVDPRQVEQIVISAIQMRDWGAGKNPHDLVSAAYSVIYFVAAGVAERRFACSGPRGIEWATWMRSTEAWCHAPGWSLRASTRAST